MRANPVVLSETVQYIRRKTEAGIFYWQSSEAVVRFAFLKALSKELMSDYGKNPLHRIDYNYFPRL